jgi:hypothetical protein
MSAGTNDARRGREVAKPLRRSPPACAPPALKRPSYRRCLEWLVYNDDCWYLDEANPTISVSAALVADMFGQPDDTVMNDVRAMRAALVVQEA